MKNSRVGWKPQNKQNKNLLNHSMSSGLENGTVKEIYTATCKGQTNFGSL